jgi:hypothetical protein
MRPARARSLPAAVLVLGAAALTGASPAAGEEADPAAAARAAAAAVRARIPEPVDDAGLEFEWSGDLVLVGEAAGTVSLSADVGVLKGKPVWLVSEEVRQEWGGSVVTTSWSLYLARDLSLLRGEASRSEGERTVHLAFVRDEATPGAFRVTREVTRRAPEGEEPRAPESADVTVAAPEGATFGHAATLLFLRHAPAEKARYLLPAAPLGTAWPRVEEHAALPDPAIRLEVKGPGSWTAKAGARPTWVVSMEHLRERADLHLAPKDRALVAAEFAAPPGTRWLPKGEAAAKPRYADDEPATSWRAAFLKFGHGYHMAVRRWLEASCHWPSVRAHDVAAGSWSEAAGGPDAVKEAYVREWLGASKHRGRAEADWLLVMTLQTAKETKMLDGTVVLKTHPEFGGNVFRFREVEGVWYIVGVDQ